MRNSAFNSKQAGYVVWASRREPGGVSAAVVLDEVAAAILEARGAVAVAEAAAQVAANRARGSGADEGDAQAAAAAARDAQIARDDLAAISAGLDEALARTVRRLGAPEPEPEPAPASAEL